MTQTRELIDRLHEDVARDLEAAAKRAGELGHEEVRIEHLLSQLLDAGRNPGLVELLASAGLATEALRSRLQQRLDGLPARPATRPAFHASLLQWLERGLLTATVQHQGNAITAAALIEALAEMAPRLADGEAFRELDDLAVERLRPVDPQAGAPASSADRQEQTLAQYTVDYTARAEAGELDPVLGRAQEIRNVMDALGRRSKNNPILVGEPGVGKTALVEGLAQRVAAGEVPPPLRNVRLLGLDLGLLQAGASVKGEFEQRVRDILDAVQQASDPVVLFIDEAHMLIGAGAEAGGSDAANLLKPALARGTLRCIAATTWSEYKRYFERDAALARRFQLVTVDEPDQDAARRMLAGLRERVEQHHAIRVTEAAVDSAVQLSARYIAGRQLPDKAVDLLDTAAARVQLAQAAPPHDLDTLRETVSHLEGRRERVDAEIATGLDTSAGERQTIVDELADARDRQAAVEAQWQHERELSDAVQDRADAERREALAQAHTEGGYVHAEVSPEAVANVVADWTGVPIGRMLEDDISAVLNLEQDLAQHVVGQEAALARIGHSLRTAKAALRRPDAPMGVFLFAGPSGVGKTETAHELAERLFGSERALTTISMSEYQEAHSVAQLKGAPPGYVGYGEGGILTEAVRRQPYSAILLDEVEKAHRDVLDLFYQIFDQGVARDGEGREIDFRNTLIMMTSNLGTEALQALFQPATDEAAAEPSAEDTLNAVTPALEQHFGTALLARAEIVPFRPLDREALARIVTLKLDALAERVRAAHGLILECTQPVIDQLADQCQLTNTGARHVERLLEDKLMPGLARQLLRFQAADDMPGLARFELDANGELSCLFADLETEAASA